MSTKFKPFISFRNGPDRVLALAREVDCDELGRPLSLWSGPGHGAISVFNILDKKTKIL